MNQALGESADDFDLRMFYGRLLRDARKFPDAEQQFLAASKMKPDAIQPWNELAGVLIVAEQYTHAIAALDRSRAWAARLRRIFICGRSRTIICMILRKPSPTTRRSLKRATEARMRNSKRDSARASSRMS